MKIEGLEVDQEDKYVDVGYSGKRYKKRLEDIADKTLNEIMEMLEDDSNAIDNE